MNGVIILFTSCYFSFSGCLDIYIFLTLFLGEALEESKFYADLGLPVPERNSPGLYINLFFVKSTFPEIDL